MITGAGGSFCSGADLTDPANMVTSPFELKDRMRKIHDVAPSVLTCSVPTIAKVTGVAAEADRLGIVNRLCEPDEVDAVTAELAGRLASVPPRTASMIKENLNRATDGSLSDSLDMESLAQASCFASDDTKEAVLAWVEKREPRFSGR